MAKMTLDDLVAQLRAVFGAELQTVVLYGSAAAGEHIPRRSDYNVLVIASALDAAHLRALSATTRAWASAGNPPPMMFTEQEWRRAIDVFPMEYADMIERHRVLYGASLFDGMRVEPGKLRLQLEHEARGKLLALRRGILSAGGEPRAELELLSASLSTVMVLLRAVERLRGEMAPADHLTLSRAVAAAAGFDATPLERVVLHVRGEAVIPVAEAPAVLDGYLGVLEALVRYLDRFVATE